MKNFTKVVRALGVVFGDIGTSPIYTMTVIFLIVPLTQNNIFGVISLLIWTLITVVTIQYTWLAMGLSKNGEGGTIVLTEILTTILKKSRKIFFFSILSYIGISLLIGDGIITPAISILSAVEGIKLIPSFSNLAPIFLLIFAAIITVLLFSMQKKGIERLANTFGPIMLAWFILMFISGIIYVVKKPIVFQALNPAYGILFLLKNKIISFFVLSQVILCATGGEALYADMGHLGSGPIKIAWFFVFIALVFCYLGQGSFLLMNTKFHGSILFNMYKSLSGNFYIPVLILTIFATIIASQAMISGIFSVVFQAINIRIFPLLKLKYTSSEMQSQIYINAVNWFLMFGTLAVMFTFKSSENLSYAYGLAESGAMFITSFLLITIFFIKKQKFKIAVSIFLLIINFLFVFSNFLKFFHGAFFPLLVGSIPFCIILIYTKGQKRLFRFLRPIPGKIFLKNYEKNSKKLNKIEGTSLYLVKNYEFIPPYVSHVMFDHKIMYEKSVFVSINIMDIPFGIEYNDEKKLASGLSYIQINVGYMENIDLIEILKMFEINESIIFYGQEDIATKNIIWHIFSFIKKNTPHFVQFYYLPANKLHGVVTRVDI